MELVVVNWKYSFLCFYIAICANGMSVKTQKLTSRTDDTWKKGTWLCKQTFYWNASHPKDYIRSIHCEKSGRFCSIAESVLTNNDDLMFVQNMSAFIGCHDDVAATRKDGFLAVVSCPEEWYGSDVYSLCTSDNSSDVMLRLPVTGNVSGLVYRNVYCAICHGESFQYWRPEVNCDSYTPLTLDANSTIEEVLKNPSCKAKFLSPHKTDNFLPCLQHASKTSTVGNNNLMAVDLCTSKELMKFVNTNPELKFLYFACYIYNNGHRICFNEYGGGIVGIRPYSFTILLDLNTGIASTKDGRNERKIERNVTIAHTCDDFRVYDPFIQVCRDVHYWTAEDPLAVIGTMNSSTDCPKLRLNESEFQLHDNGTLQHILSGHKYDVSEYYFDNDYAIVCTNLTQNYTETKTIFDTNIDFNFSMTTAIITFVGLVLSLVGLLLTITIYLMFKTLRNVPGKIILSLTFSLFLAEGLLLFASQVEDYPSLCKLFAILMHYLFLESFLWMNVMAGDVWFTFSKSFVKPGDRGKSSKRFFIYNVYVRGVAIIVVAFAITVDYVLPKSQFRPNYGDELCWFTNKRGLLVFFALPVFFIVLVNLVLFSLAAKSIYLSKRKSAVYLAKRDNAQFSIYAKLAFVMGLTWIFGFLASVFPFPAIWYIYIIFNSLQGLFICIGFVFTRKVLSLVRERFHSFGRRTSASDQMPSSPTRTMELSHIGNRIRRERNSEAP